MYTPLINGTAYSWAQIKVNILGTPVTGITAIKYTEEQEMQDNFGAGNRPVSRGYGGITAGGSITLHMEEIEALQQASATGSLMDIPEFDIVVSFLPAAGIIRTHTLHNCRFKKNERDIKQGDMEIAVELDLQISHVTWK